MADFNLKKITGPQNEPLKQTNLQDLAVSASITPNEYGGIYDKPKKPRVSFLQSRLNKDNFWNLMFFAGMNFGFGVAALIMVLTDNKFPTTTSIIMWITLLTVPYIVKRNSRITFDKEKLQFLNRNNEVLNDRAPNFFLMLIVTFAGSGFTAFILDSLKDFISPSIFPAIFMMMLIFIPTTYCILKNFPIAVYFKKETYIGNGTARSSYSDKALSGHNTNSILRLNRLRNAPINSWHSTNIYHRNR